jgi:methionine-rich copper-binding protein CopC
MTGRRMTGRRMIGRPMLVRFGAVLGLVLLGTFGAASTASAHNVLLKTDPADKSTVATLPTQITLTYNEPALALGSVLEVVGPSGNVADGPPKLVDREVRQAVRPGSPAGAYRVIWRVTSIDGHPISGEFAFTASAGDGGTAPSAPQQTTASSSGATGTSPLPAETDSDGGSKGWATPLIVVLIALGLVVVIRPSVIPDRVTWTTTTVRETDDGRRLTETADGCPDSGWALTGSARVSVLRAGFGRRNSRPGWRRATPARRW